MKWHIDPERELRKIERSFYGVALDIDQLEGDREQSCLRELSDPRILTLCRQLQPGTVRLGGSGTEYTWFVEDDPNGEAATPEGFYQTVDRLKCNAVGDFCNALDAQMILCFGMYNNAIENSARFIDTFVNQRNQKMAGLQMANEPDWSFKDEANLYAQRFRAFYEALYPRFPGQQWLGGFGGRTHPHGVSRPDSSLYYEFLEQCGDLVDAVTVHYYAASSNRPYATRDYLLGPNGANVGANRLAELKGLLDHFGLDKPILITECNSFASKGAEGISNDMPAALWLADFIGQCARHDVQVFAQQCPFARQHGKQPFWRYAMVDTRDGQARANPHYYAYYLWSRWMGEILLPTYADNGHPVAVHATRTNDGELRIMVVNKADSEQPVELDFEGATVESVQACDLCADPGHPTRASIGGSQVDEDGCLDNPRFQEMAAKRAGSVVFAMPGSTARLLRLRLT